MKTMRIGGIDLNASRIGLGCMAMGGSWDKTPVVPEFKKQSLNAISYAIDLGINFFDHADIYSCGKSEEVFSGLWESRPSIRDKVIVQSKCGVRDGRYDFSKEHILSAVDGSLERLKTDYLDILLLHRPDALVEPEEVADAFDALHKTGRVRYFGVSNQTASQMQLLKKYVRQPLIANQVCLSVCHAQLIEEGMYGNTSVNAQYLNNAGTLEYCRINDITLQAYNPLVGGRLFSDRIEEKHKGLLNIITELAETKGVSREAIMIAWLLRHPAKIQPIIGTRTPARIEAACEADTFELSREEWYRLYSGDGLRPIL